jgi:hypothetical protein
MVRLFNAAEEPNMLHELKTKEAERRVFAVFHRLESPGGFVSEVGYQVFDTFIAAWNELTTPSWGDRAIYWTHVPVGIMEDQRIGKGLGVDRPYLLTERRGGWFLLTPDDLTVLRMEIALAGDIFAERAMRDSSSWFIQVVDRLVDIRAHDRDKMPTTAVNAVAHEKGDIDPTDALQYALSVLPVRIGDSLKSTIVKLQTTIQAGEDEINSLKNLVARQEKLHKKRDDEERQKQLRFLQGGVPTESLGDPRLGALMREAINNAAGVARAKKAKEDSTLDGFRKAIEAAPCVVREEIIKDVERIIQREEPIVTRKG